MSYAELLARKSADAPLRGLSSIPSLHEGMFAYQRDVTEFLLGVGGGAAFLDTGLGKSFVALEWARVVSEQVGKPVLMLAPLAVAPQHVREAMKFGYEDARVVRSQDDVGPGINVTNYAKIDHFDPSTFAGVVLDESSVIKNFTGQTTRKMIAMWKDTPFRLACTATPVWNFSKQDLPETDVLNVKVARSDKDEKHLCPMPLNITKRALRMWSNAGDTVFSPFMGIGSEGYVSLQNNRRFIGTELNPNYFKQAVKNLGDAAAVGEVPSLFGDNDNVGAANAA